MGISSVGSFPVQFRGSLMVFQLFRCRNLALNRFFQLFLSGRHVFFTWGCLDAPICSYALPYVCMLPGVCTSLGFRHPHMSSIVLSGCMF